jgi:hypothetical protein
MREQDNTEMYCDPNLSSFRRDSNLSSFGLLSMLTSGVSRWTVLLVNKSMPARMRAAG